MSSKDLCRLVYAQPGIYTYTTVVIGFMMSRFLSYLTGEKTITEIDTTEQRIKKEFVSMLNSSSYAEIRVKDLASSMGMTRQNFYRYYSSKEQILSELIEDSVESLVAGIEEFSPVLDNQVWGVLIELALNSFKANKELTYAIMRSGADELVYKYTRAFLSRTLGHFARINNIKVTDHDYFSLMASHFSGAMYHTVKDWCDKDMRVPVKDVSQMLRVTANDALAALLQNCTAPAASE